jgi:hypothetical protein
VAFEDRQLLAARQAPQPDGPVLPAGGQHRQALVRLLVPGEAEHLRVVAAQLAAQVAGARVPDRDRRVLHV